MDTPVCSRCLITVENDTDVLVHTTVADRIATGNALESMRGAARWSPAFNATETQGTANFSVLARGIVAPRH